MSLAAQHYLKDMLHSLKIIAWQRRGGLTGDLLSGELPQQGNEHNLFTECSWSFCVFTAHEVLAVRAWTGYSSSNIRTIQEKNTAVYHRLLRHLPPAPASNPTVQ